MPPSYFLPSIYLGVDEDAQRLHNAVRSTAKANRAAFRSQNEFVRHCLTYTLRNDKTLKKPSK